MDGTEHEIDELQDPKADDLDRAVEARDYGAFGGARGYRAPRVGGRSYWHSRKLDSTTYGKCEACLEKPLNMCATCPFIPKPRLEALPTARLCVSCQEAEEQNQIPSYTRLRPRRMFGEDIEEFSHPLMDSEDDK